MTTQGDTEIKMMKGNTNKEQVQYMTKVKEMTTFHYDGPANIESSCRQIDYNMATCTVTDYNDRVAFPPSSFLEEINSQSKLKQLCKAGDTYVSLLYTYRSVSRCFAINNIKDDKKFANFYQLSFTVLHPEIQKLIQVMNYHNYALQVLYEHFIEITGIEKANETQSHILLSLFIKCIDILVQLDAIKNNKSCLTNDFATYKRSFTRIKQTLVNSEEIENQITDQQTFLVNIAHPRDLIIYNLHEKQICVKDMEFGISALQNHCQETLVEKYYVLPDEVHTNLRVIPYLFYLLDYIPNPNNKNILKLEYNAFKSKYIDLQYFKKLFKQYPIIPQYGDMYIKILYLQRNCPHWDEKMIDEWCCTDKELLNIQNFYLLNTHHNTIRDEYNRLTRNFMALLNEIKAYQENNISVTPAMLERVLKVVQKCICTISSWSERIRQQCSWKYANPQTREQYYKTIGKRIDIEQQHPGEAYKMAVRYNYTPDEQYTLIDIIGMIKGMGSMMLENQEFVTPLQNHCIHDDIQIFLQTEVARPLRKAYKNERNDVKEILMQMREFCGDWYDYDNQKDDYLKIKKELLQVNRDFPRRPTAPTLTALTLVRRMMYTVFSPKARGMNVGLFREKNLKDEWLPVWKNFYHDSFYYTYLLDYGNTVKEVTDLSFLWQREFHLDITGCVQFPISMSLPWILTEFIIHIPELKDNIFFPFDIYNDVAAYALYRLKQQFIYQEVEAELNLSFDQQIYFLSQDVYSYYKTVAGNQQLDPLFKQEYENSKLTSYTILQNILRKGQEKDRTKQLVLKRRSDILKKQNNITIPYAYYTIQMKQTHILLLGRSINVTLLQTGYCNHLIRENINIVQMRQESCDLTSILETYALLQNIYQTHQLLSKILNIDKFSEMYKEINNNVYLCNFETRLVKYIYNELIYDILPNYSYNSTTNRFVQQITLLGTLQSQRKRPSIPSNIDSYQWYGRKQKDINERKYSQYRDFLSLDHILTIVSQLSKNEQLSLINNITNYITNQISTEIWLYFEAQIKGTQINKLQDLQQVNLLTIYQYYQLKFKKINGWNQQYTGQFPKQRQQGNILGFQQQLEAAISYNDLYKSQYLSYLHNEKPVDQQSNQLINSLDTSNSTLNAATANTCAPTTMITTTAKTSIDGTTLITNDSNNDTPYFQRVYSDNHPVLTALKSTLDNLQRLSQECTTSIQTISNFSSTNIEIYNHIQKSNTTIQNEEKYRWYNRDTNIQPVKLNIIENTIDMIKEVDKTIQNTTKYVQPYFIHHIQLDINKIQDENGFLKKFCFGGTIQKNTIQNIDTMITDTLHTTNIGGLVGMQQFQYNIYKPSPNEQPLIKQYGDSLYYGLGQQQHVTNENEQFLLQDPNTKQLDVNKQQDKYILSTDNDRGKDMINSNSDIGVAATTTTATAITATTTTVNNDSNNNDIDINTAAVPLDKYFELAEYSNTVQTKVLIYLNNYIPKKMFNKRTIKMIPPSYKDIILSRDINKNKKGAIYSITKSQTSNTNIPQLVTSESQLSLSPRFQISQSDSKGSSIRLTRGDGQPSISPHIPLPPDLQQYQSQQYTSYNKPPSVPQPWVNTNYAQQPQQQQQQPIKTPSGDLNLPPLPSTMTNDQPQQAYGKNQYTYSAQQNTQQYNDYDTYYNFSNYSAVLPPPPPP